MKFLLILIALFLPAFTNANTITSSDGNVQVLPCAVKAQNCIRLKLIAGSDVANIWINQPTGGTASVQYGATYPAQWNVNAPLDVEIVNPSGDYLSANNELFVYYGNYVARWGFSIDDMTDPPSFYLINGCPNTVNVDDCSGGGSEEPEEPSFVDPDLFRAPVSNLLTHATTTCTQTSSGTSTPHTYECISVGSPLITQDAGNISFALAILIVLMFLMVVGFMYNNLTKKKPWR